MVFRSSTPDEPRPFSAEKAAVLQVHGLDRVDVDPRLQPAGHGVRDIEAVQSVVGLIRVAAVEVDPAGVVLHHAVQKRQRIAVILRGRVGDGLDLGIGQFLAFRGLLRIDGSRRIGDVDVVGEFLQVVQADGELLGPASNGWLRW